MKTKVSRCNVLFYVEAPNCPCCSSAFDERGQHFNFIFSRKKLRKMERHYVIKQQSEMLQKCFQKSEMHKQKDMEESDEAMNVYQKLQKSEMLKQQKEMSEDDENPWELPETQRFVPIHNVSRAMKKVVPHTGKVAKDAGRSVQVESTSLKKAPY